MIRRVVPLVVVLLAVVVAAWRVGTPRVASDPKPPAQQVAAASIPGAQPTVPPPTATVVPTPPVETTASAPTSAAPEETPGTRLPTPTPGASGQSVLYSGDHLLSDDDDDAILPLQVALTWDAGADTGYTAELLDMLIDYDIKGSFGMTGQWAENNPDLVKRIVDEGHMVFNHTWTHKSMTGVNGGLPPMTREELLDEVQRTEEIVTELTGVEMKPYFRPPYGDYDAQTLGWLAEMGYHVTVYWTCDTRGWAGWSAEKIVGYCTTNIAWNEIILLHVGADAITDLYSLPGQIDFFRSQGYEFVTVEEMIQPDVYSKSVVRRATTNNVVKGLGMPASLERTSTSARYSRLS